MHLDERLRPVRRAGALVEGVHRRDDRRHRREGVLPDRLEVAQERVEAGQLGRSDPGQGDPVGQRRRQRGVRRHLLVGLELAVGQRAQQVAGRLALDITDTHVHHRRRASARGSRQPGTIDPVDPALLLLAARQARPTLGSAPGPQGAGTPAPSRRRPA